MENKEDDYNSPAWKGLWAKSLAVEVKPWWDRRQIDRLDEAILGWHGRVNRSIRYPRYYEVVHKAMKAETQDEYEKIIAMGFLSG